MKVDKIYISLSNVSVSGPVLLGKTEVNQMMECINNSTISQKVNCSLSASDRNIQSISNVTYPLNINLIANTTIIDLITNSTYYTNNTFLFSDVNPIVNLNVSSIWEFHGITPVKNNIESSYLGTQPSILLPQCKIVTMNFNDVIYDVSFSYSATSTLSAFNDSRIQGEDLVLLGNEVFNSDVDAVYSENYITFQTYGEMRVNVIQPILQDIQYRDCSNNESSTNSPIDVPITSSPFTPIPIENTDLSKLAVFALPQSQYNQIFNYQNVISSLVIQKCYRAWVIVLTGWIPFTPIPIFLPMWVKPQAGEQENTNVINSEIPSHLQKDISRIVTTGRFLSNSSDLQIVVNDLNGIKFYTKSYEFITAIPNFCSRPFMITPSQNTGRCNTISVEGIDAYECNGQYSCSSLEFWYLGVKYSSNSQFYNNHDLIYGGIRVGDFDGNGIDDVWCHYPGTTQGYSSLSNGANQIIYSPLQQNYTNGDKCSYITTLEIAQWCENGIVKVGDFNNDGRSDALCISNFDLSGAASISGYSCENILGLRDGLILDSTYYKNLGSGVTELRCVYYGFLLLYGSSGTFISASGETDGRLVKVGSVINGWDKHQKIFVGDFDGDNYSDLLKINKTNIDVIFGSKTDLFVSRSNVTAMWSSNANSQQDFSTQLSTCYNTDIHKIIIEDINEDNRDDIICLSESGILTKIYSRISPFTQSIFKIIMLVENVVLQPVTYLQDIQRNIDLKTQHHMSMIGANQKSRFFLESEIQKKTVQEIYFPHDNFKLQGFDTEINFVIDSSYSVPEKVLWSYGKEESYREIDIEMSAKWINGELQNFSSNPLYSFDLVAENTHGSCLNSILANGYISLIINYNASLRIFVEEESEIIVGSELKLLVRKIADNFELDEVGTSAILPIQGHINANILGVGYEDIASCN